LISSYNLEWDKDGTQTAFHEIVGQSLSFTGTSYVISNQVVAGTTYHFRVRAKNKWGYGPYSPVVAIQASTNPQVVPMPLTTNIGAKVRISWPKPEINGDEIDEYQVLIKQKDGTFAEQEVYCDGSQPAIITSRQCEIPLTVLRAAPFSLVVKVQARNGNGWTSSFSEVNLSGALIQTEPAVMLPVSRGSQTSEVQIHVQW
jgi:hypothetical protein